MWEFYLALCEVGFRHRTNVVFQVQLARRFDAVPITRDYVLEWERHGRWPARPCAAEAGAATLRR